MGEAGIDLGSLNSELDVLPLDHGRSPQSARLLYNGYDYFLIAPPVLMLVLRICRHIPRDCGVMARGSYTNGGLLNPRVCLRIKAVHLRWAPSTSERPGDVVDG